MVVRRHTTRERDLADTAQREAYVFDDETHPDELARHRAAIIRKREQAIRDYCRATGRDPLGLLFPNDQLVRHTHGSAGVDPDASRADHSWWAADAQPVNLAFWQSRAGRALVANQVARLEQEHARAGRRPGEEAAADRGLILGELELIAHGLFPQPHPGREHIPYCAPDAPPIVSPLVASLVEIDFKHA